MKSCAAEGRWEVLLHLVEEAILVEEEAGAARVGLQLVTWRNWLTRDRTDTPRPRQQTGWRRSEVGVLR